MGAKTGIEWTDSTWNPIRGCSRVSEGCRNCYAERTAYRFSGPGQPYEGLAVLKNGHASWTGAIKFVEEHLLDPMHWKTPRRIFVNSMSDLFHENVTDEMRDRIFAVMAHCSATWFRCVGLGCDHCFCDENKLREMPVQTFQILTKRPARMLAYISSPGRREAIVAAFDSLGWYFENPPIDVSLWPLPNVWLGVSVENQATADERLSYLCELGIDGWQTMVSFEPLLGNIMPLPKRWLDLGPRTWAIVGGESGPGARPMHPDWARVLRDPCISYRVPFFFKQWGEWLPAMQDGRAGNGQILNASDVPERVGKHAAGALLDGMEWKQFPEARA